MEDFFIENKIYYHDTDTGGVVYYATYLEHLEESRTEHFRSMGVNVADYTAQNILFPVVHISVDYKCPARYGDKIKIYSKLDNIGNASMQFSQEIKRDEKLLVTAKVVLACVDSKMKPRRIPEEIRDKFSIHQSGRK